MSNLTPYDTGERAEPFRWVSDTSMVRDRATGVKDSDRYGRVDFDDDEGHTIATVYVARSGIDGSYVMHIEPDDDDLLVIDHRTEA